LITGKVLFGGTDALAILAQQLCWELLPAEEIREGLDADLYAVLHATLAMDPEDRVLDLDRLAEQFDAAG
jgi:hypothetical protein